MLRTMNSMDDIREAYRISTDPAIVEKAGTWDRPVPIGAYVASKQQTWGVTDNGFQLLVVDDGCPEVVIGVVNVSGIDRFHRRAYVGIIMDPKYQGKGYGTKALDELVSLCFKDYGLEKLYAEIYTFNVGSIRLFERAGFRLEGTLIEHDFRHGNRQTVLLYGLSWYRRTL